jgi:hypothetical protein
MVNSCLRLNGTLPISFDYLRADAKRSLFNGGIGKELSIKTGNSSKKYRSPEGKSFAEIDEELGVEEEASLEHSQQVTERRLKDIV